MRPLTTRQQQAYQLRCTGKSLREIAKIMATTREPVRKWIAAARYKLGLPPEALEEK